MTTEQTVALEFAKYRLKTERKRIIALGLFDSVHLGHRSIIDYTFETAKRLNMTPAILTFDNDFFSALGRSDKLIYTLHERVKILEEFGFSNQNILVQPSDVQYMSLSGEDFVRYLKQLNAGAVVCGGDYRFGKGGKWGAADLCKLSRDYGIAPFVCPLIKEWDRKISSSDIREYFKITQGSTLRSLVNSVGLLTGYLGEASDSADKGGGVEEVFNARMMTTLNMESSELKDSASTITFIYRLYFT